MTASAALTQPCCVLDSSLHCVLHHPGNGIIAFGLICCSERGPAGYSNSPKVRRPAGHSAGKHTQGCATCWGVCHPTLVDQETQSIWCDSALSLGVCSVSLEDFTQGLAWTCVDRGSTAFKDGPSLQDWGWGCALGGC
jgi:hypothetical protein